ncbi:MAG: restriction endonuclease subunit S, partial [bacterium]
MTLQRGHDLPDSDRQEGDVPVITSSGITGSHNVAKAKGPGVVTGRYGTLGEVFYVDQDYWPHNTSLYVIDFKGNVPRFIAYFLEHHLKHQQSDKAAVPGVNRNVLHELRVRYPDCTAQEKIVDVLASYDHLMVANRRRAELLEEAARQLHREWFARLRFPGFEHANIVQRTPHDWTSGSFGDYCDEIRESVAPDAMDPDTPYIGLEHIPRRSISLCEWGNVDEVTSSKHRYHENDILFGKIRPYFHKVGIAFTDGVASSDAIVIRPKDAKLLPLVLMTASSDPFVAATSQTMREGSKMPRADWKQMQAYPVPLPPDGLLQSFNDFINPILAQLKTLSFMNRRLKAARDLLLPRLMSG